MNRIILVSAILLFSRCATTAQGTNSTGSLNNEYLRVMETNIKQLDTASTAVTFRSLANNFERIGNAEKNKWEPFYYAAYCYGLMAVNADPASIDMLADKADSYLGKAIAINDNSETSALNAMIISVRIMVDPMSRFQSFGSEAAAEREKAKQQDPKNPRPYFLEANMQVRVPEAMGGGKDVAKGLLEIAIEKFKTFQPASTIAPQWGYLPAKKMMEGLSK